jgi:ligand-binding SRPBCC domain-containing protein
MTLIKLSTTIKAPIQIVFDLSRNIDVHKLSTSKSKETAIAGVTTGLINKNETVTWRGRHFGIFLTHKSLLSEMEIPSYFVDKMVEGKFKSFRHEHTFLEKADTTVMIDSLLYETPFGIFGKIFDRLFLRNHLLKFIKERNEFIKKLAEEN